MKTELEIERKFLLKSLPFIKGGYGTHLEIIQYYCSLEGEPDFRIRESINMETGKVTYTKTVKIRLAAGTYEETEGKIKESVFNKYKESATKVIKKKRCIIKFGKLKWEIDVYDFKLVVAEIEIPSMDYLLELPDYIKEVLIMEVTKFKQFSNKSLAISI